MLTGAKQALLITNIIPSCTWKTFQYWRIVAQHSGSIECFFLHIFLKAVWTLSRYLLRGVLISSYTVDLIYKFTEAITIALTYCRYNWFLIVVLSRRRLVRKRFWYLETFFYRGFFLQRSFVTEAFCYRGVLLKVVSSEN